MNSLLNQNLSFKQSLESENRKIKVYLRINSSKKGTDFVTDSKTTDNQLVLTLERIIEQNNLLTDQNTTLTHDLQFTLEGRKILRQSQNVTELRELCIIHVLNKKNIERQNISVILRYQSPNQSKDLTHRVQVKSNQTIGEVVNQIVQLQFNKFSNDVSLVYGGHQISFEKTFSQESVEDGSEIIVIDKLRNGLNEEQFETSEEIPLGNFGVKFNWVRVSEENDPLVEMGLDMPYNPKIAQSQVKKLLQLNVQANQMEIEQNNNPQGNDNYNWNGNPPGSEQVAPVVPNLIQINQNEHQMNLPFAEPVLTMDEQKQIPTKEQIQEEKNSQKNIE